jgi:uncharacterized RDD family membrane protein YckC
MTCGYCGTRNNEGEHRCRRCGRKPDDVLTGEYTLPRSNGALAAQPVLRHRTTESTPEARTPSADLSRAVQRPLFQDRTSKVVPIAPFTPASPKRGGTGRTAQKTQRRVSRVPEEQGSLDFLPPATPKPRTLDTSVEAVIYCEERVAGALHRAFAAALDWSMVLIAYGVFLAVVQFWVGVPSLNKTNLLILGSVLPLFGFVYGLVWAWAGTETAGMKWTELRLTTFEGFRPEPRERLLRFAGSCLSLCAVIGVLWALADEEGLGWHDHISRTFPTPKRGDSQVFHRR